MGPDGVPGGRMTSGEYEAVLEQFSEVGVQGGSQGDSVLFVQDETGDDI